jgi:very-short-patch-repair endonuclease
MSPKEMARMLRRNQTKEEKQLWKSLRAGRFAGFTFRRQHPVGDYYLDFYCAQARLCVELDGFQHGHPLKQAHDRVRQTYLDSQGIKVLRFWNHQWRRNRDGVLLAIWQALHAATDCVALERKKPNHRFIPPCPKDIKSPDPSEG